MAVDTYANLQATLASWLIRTDLTSQIQDFITLQESEFQRVLKTPEMEASTTLSTTSGSPLVALPTGFMGIRRLRVLVLNAYYDVPIVSLDPSLDSGVFENVPMVASIVGTNLYFKPLPNGTYSLPLDYWARFTPLSDTNTTNWILTSYPDAYLYGSLTQAAGFLGQDPRLPIWAEKYANALQQISDENLSNQFGNMTLRVDPALQRISRNYGYWNGYGRWS